MQNFFLPEGSLIKRGTNTAIFKDIESIKKAISDGTIAEGEVLMCDSMHNLIVRIEGYTGIIYKDEAAIGIKEGKVKDIAILSRVGKAVSFVIEDIDESGRLILSRKKAQQQAKQYFFENLKSGDIIKAKITHFESFGAFCDIGCGITSLIGIENISISRIEHPSDRFKIGQDILAVVFSVDFELERINLSHKELLGTWEENVAGFKIGETVKGIIRGVESYGIFVELTPNLSGLAEFKEGFKPGDSVSVYIKNINLQKMKVKLVIIDKLKMLPESLYTYFIKDEKIDYFRYTPYKSLAKVIETTFNK